MAKVHIESVRELIEKAGHIRRQLTLGVRRIGNVHIGGPMSATDAAGIAKTCLEFLGE